MPYRGDGTWHRQAHLFQPRPVGTPEDGPCGLHLALHVQTGSRAGEYLPGPEAFPVAAVMPPQQFRQGVFQQDGVGITCRAKFRPTLGRLLGPQCAGRRPGGRFRVMPDVIFQTGIRAGQLQAKFAEQRRFDAGQDRTGAKQAFEHGLTDAGGQRERGGTLAAAVRQRALGAVPGGALPQAGKRHGPAVARTGGQGIRAGPAAAELETKPPPGPLAVAITVQATEVTQDQHRLAGCDGAGLFLSARVDVKGTAAVIGTGRQHADVESLTAPQALQAIQKDRDVRLKGVHGRGAVDEDVHAGRPRQPQTARQALDGTQSGQVVDQTRQIDLAGRLHAAQDATQMGPEPGPGLEWFRPAQIGLRAKFFHANRIRTDLRGRLDFRPNVLFPIACGLQDAKLPLFLLRCWFWRGLDTAPQVNRRLGIDGDKGLP